MRELRVAVPAAWYLALCTRAAYDSGLEYETSPSLPVTQGYSFSLLQGQPQPHPGQVTSLAQLATWEAGLKA